MSYRVTSLFIALCFIGGARAFKFPRIRGIPGISEIIDGKFPCTYGGLLSGICPPIITGRFCCPNLGATTFHCCSGLEFSGWIIGGLVIISSVFACCCFCCLRYRNKVSTPVVVVQRTRAHEGYEMRDRVNV